MTFPPQQPPSPSGYQSVPPRPPTMGPGGAYGPTAGPAGQPVPGQMAAPVMTMDKPGTVTGIQVILWIFLAIAAVGDVFSIINMIDFFHPLSLIALAYALYTTIQSVLTPVHIARGKRWAWIWNLVSAIIGLVFAAVGIVFGTIAFGNGGEIALAVGGVLAALYGTLLGLLCSKSARQWILMHRIQRGEVQVSGMPGAPGVAGPPQPERPETRPGAATVAVIAVWLFAALCAWGVWVNVDSAMAENARYSEYTSLPGAFLDGDNIWMRGIPTVVYAVLLICAVICAPGLMKGSAAARVFGVVWSIGAILSAGLLLVFVYLEYREYRDFIPPWESNPYPMMFARHIALQVLAVAVFALMLVPGVRKWTPRRPAAALVMMVPMGQPGTGAPQAVPPQRYPPSRF
ncbi:hypothetical protein [Glycomyces tenuis]|uniref:hypothetical protein n=1 Tax=Glycomyces tenuis TaxID=58116 RepID=UPI0012DC1417|nr:hypothetical protein [Glycomyces tenuis]